MVMRILIYPRNEADAFLFSFFDVRKFKPIPLPLILGLEPQGKNKRQNAERREDNHWPEISSCGVEHVADE